VVAGVALLAAGYARWVEPYWIQVTHHRVAAPVSPPLKIAHLSDLHTREFGRRERAVLALLEAEKPDVIVVTGDTLSGDGSYDHVRELLSKLRAPLGVFVVRGNWENFRPAKNERQLYASAGVNFLLNESRSVRGNVWLVGFDVTTWLRPNEQAALSAVPPESYLIALYHMPVLFDHLPGKVRLALAGHTHGGQVRIPLFDPVWLPPGTGDYLEGWYEKNGSRMYVTRGVGTSVLHFRFACRPEVAFLTLGE
jgi:predicted MPP superfamily phosphohydrolase